MLVCEYRCHDRVITGELPLLMKTKVVTKENKTPEIPVTYRCWGCGAIKVEYEAREIAVPAIEIWNVCPDCQGQVISEGMK